MAKKMGVRAPPKQCQWQPVTAAISSSTSQHIEAVNVKRKLLFTDAYNREEQSGKHAKADAVSGVANALAHSMAPSY